MIVVKQHFIYRISSNSAKGKIFIDFMLTLIINALKDNPFVTQAELSKIVGITEKSIKSNMKKLQQNHLISRIGADKNGRWEVIND